MKLLVDHNLSPKLATFLDKHFPGSLHVSTINMQAVDDNMIWKYAQKYAMHIVSRDSDFITIQRVKGFPPKLILFRLDNCSNSVVLKAFLKVLPDIKRFLADPKLQRLDIQ